MIDVEGIFNIKDEIHDQIQDLSDHIAEIKEELKKTEKDPYLLKVNQADQVHHLIHHLNLTGIFNEIINLSKS